MRVYLDAAPVIYLIERHSVLGPRVLTWLAANPAVLVSSDLTRLETLVLPIRKGDRGRVADFDSFFHLRVNESVAFARPLFERAADIRAKHRFKTVDSLHLAAAVEATCDVFLTNDHRLVAFTGIAVEVI